MNYTAAKTDFYNAATQTNDYAIRALAEGLQKLAAAIEQDLKAIKSEIMSISR